MHSSWRSASQGKCILFLWGSEDRERCLFPTRSRWLLLDVGLHQGLWEAESQNRRAFALFTIVVLNGQKITDRICHVLPLSRLCPLHTKRPKDNSSLEPKRREIWILHLNTSLCNDHDMTVVAAHSIVFHLCILRMLPSSWFRANLRYTFYQYAFLGIKLMTLALQVQCLFAIMLWFELLRRCFHKSNHSWRSHYRL